MMKYNQGAIMDRNRLLSTGPQLHGHLFTPPVWDFLQIQSSCLLQAPLVPSVIMYMAIVSQSRDGRVAIAYRGPRSQLFASSPEYRLHYLAPLSSRFTPTQAISDFLSRVCRRSVTVRQRPNLGTLHTTDLARD